MALIHQLFANPIFQFVFQVFGAYLSAVTASMMLEAPRKLIQQAGVVGGIGYVAYLLVLPNSTVPLATFYACVVVAICAQVSARVFKAPVTIFYIPAFFPYVPGSAIYQTALTFIQGDTAASASHLSQTLMIAGAIALGVFTVDSMLEIYNYLSQKRKA
ncbi:threonine/serine exporter family protein [Hutsoniella sourekii]|uniref:threonine/serine exporter family protein n=1 Tax=Hutsoniella sourekii TaxID=87650 RepID=UPI0004AD72E2|nr:threonine/serine exporter family protein [Hutsoniella sourekii]